MGDTILFISDEKSPFFVNSIVERLEANYEVKQSNGSIQELSEIKTAPNIILLYAGESIYQKKKQLIYLQDTCIEMNRKIGVIGKPEERGFVVEILTENQIWKEFDRPVDMPYMIDEIQQELENQKNEELKKHIMIVDDSAMTLRTVRSWLSQKYKVSVANSATMAISVITKKQPDLILLDYEMPVCSGPLLLEILRGEESTKDIPVFFLTGKNDPESVKSAINLNPEGYFLKTIKPMDLIAAIDEYFASHT